MSDPTAFALAAITLIGAFTGTLIYTIRTFARIVAEIAAHQPDTHIHLPEQPAPEVHLELTEPPDTASLPDPTLTLPGYQTDPTDSTVPRINVDWSPDLDPPTDPYIPDPTDPTA